MYSGILSCTVPYGIVLMIAFWNLPKRLSAEIQLQEEVRQDNPRLSMVVLTGSNASEEQEIN